MLHHILFYIVTYDAAFTYLLDCKTTNAPRYWQFLEDPVGELTAVWSELDFEFGDSYKPVSLYLVFL